MRGNVKRAYRKNKRRNKMEEDLVLLTQAFSSIHFPAFVHEFGTLIKKKKYMVKEQKHN